MTRRQNDRGHRPPGPEPLADREPVVAGKVDVEEDDVGRRSVDDLDRRRPVDGLSDDPESAPLEHVPNDRPEGAMIIDDHDGAHARIVARRIGVSLG